MRRLSRREEGQERCRYRSKNRGVDQSILSFPYQKLWISLRCTLIGESRRRREHGSVEIPRQIVPIKQHMNLTTPHDVVCGGQFRYIRHVDVNDRVWVGDIYSLTVCGLKNGHGGEENEEEKEKKKKAAKRKRKKY